MKRKIVSVDGGFFVLSCRHRRKISDWQNGSANPLPRVGGSVKCLACPKDSFPERRRHGGWGFQDFLDMNDECGMPEGAAWALAEEMAGLGPGEGIDHITRRP